MVIRWLLAGCVLVSIAFFVPGRSSELWPTLNSAGIVVLVYLVALLATFLRSKDLAGRRKYGILAVALIGVLGCAFSWWQMEDQSRWQKKTLGEIGSIIGRGIYTSFVTDSLLSVLDEYHHQTGRVKLTLGQVYAKRCPPGKVGVAWSSFAQNGIPNPPDDVFLASISDTEVVLVARQPWYKGKDTTFATYQGPRGTLQVRATLTAKGVRYVTEN